MIVRQLGYLFKRTVDGVRRRPWLHLLSFCTLFATFLCFSLTLSLARNFDRLVDRWMGGAEITVYIKGGVPDTEVDRLLAALSETPEVAQAKRVSARDAKEMFAAEMGEFGDMVRSLPTSAFPVSLEIRINPSFLHSDEARKMLGERIGALSMVEKVDLYDDWFSKLSALSTVGRAASVGLGLSALIVAVLVISAVVRTGVTARAREMEVLGYVGATQRYIRFPFLLEGALEAALAMLLALACMQVLIFKTEAAIREVMPIIGLNALAGFSAGVVALLTFGGAAAGLFGSRLSMKGTG